MVDMHPMLMPDRKKIQEGNYPAEWVFSVFTDSCFKSLYQNFDGIWKSLGKDSKSDPPKAPDVPQVAPANIGSFTNYAEVAVQLKRSYSDLNSNVTELVNSIRESGKWSEAGQQVTNKVIDEKIVAMAPTAPPQGIQIDSFILTWVTAANDSLATEIDTVRQGQSGVARDIDDQTKMIKELQDQIKKLEAAANNPAGTPPPVDTSNWPTTPGVTDPTVPPAVDNSDFPPGLDGLDDPTSPSTTLPDLDTPGSPGSTGQTPSSLDPSGTTPGVTTPTTPSVPVTPATSPMGSGMDLMSSMLPMMMQQAMMRNMADQDLNSRRRDLDPSRYDDELDAVAPPPVAPPVTAQPAVAQPSTTAPATQHATAPTGTTSTQPAVAPGRTPDADGSVTYTFPDGRTQKVSAMVAQVLDAAFGNHASTDGQKAYEKTPAKWSDKKQIGQRVGDYQLMTGDVATWTNSTAILVVFPSDQGGTLEVIVKGELKPFDPKMPEIASETNTFEGFAHPNGIEVTAPADGGAPSGTPGSADQSAAAAMPVVATPAG
ncbi:MULTISPECIES: hypothetical protein [Nocardia]|uniref:WXG100 family type VII secretion target n=1 Tax=Nocardia sputorum TaxID=2984338 RepID=A0ABM8D3S6_9NOCA|nr:hypothetical protein [Nocardia sputorum]BDT94843.1 hypothetical protein IFM12275_48190 [Nocardia sputorum]BDU01906.1 hypothetical protein IFM12276_49340 [Nocardia sputorum]